MNKLAAFFKIEAGEGQLVALLLAQFFFIGMAQVISQAISMALFLTAFTIQDLPYVYLLIALVVSLIAWGYLRLSRKVPLPRLLTALLGILLISAVAVWSGLHFTDPHWLLFALPMWFRALSSLSNLAFWTLVGGLFDLRQGKRLFGVVGAGVWIAFITGGLLMPTLVRLLGTINLIWLVACSLVLAITIQTIVVRIYGQRILSRTAPAKTTYQEPLQEFLKNRYVVLIFALIALSWITLFFVDNIFYDRTHAQFPSAADLAAFIGLFSAIQGMVALFCNAILAPRLISRYGLRPTLLAMPVTVMISLGMLAIIGFGQGAVILLFWLAVTARLGNIALTYSLERSAISVVYQPLPGSQRVKIQTTAEGIVQPLAIGVAGLMLLVLITLAHLGVIEISIGACLIVVGYIAVAVALTQEYPVALLRALSKRRLIGEELAVVDKSHIALLKAELENPHPAAVLYALNQLEAIAPELLPELLPVLLTHPAQEIQQEALTTVERMKFLPALPVLQNLFEQTSSIKLREHALRVMTLLADDASLQTLIPYLNDIHDELRRGVLVGLQIRTHPLARETLVQLARAPSVSDRIMTAQVLAESPGNTDLLNLLVQDRDPVVQCSALTAVGKAKSGVAWPAVIKALENPKTRSAARSALYSGEVAPVQDLCNALVQGDYPLDARLQLVQILGLIGDNAAIMPLISLLDADASKFRAEVLASLHHCGYKAADDQSQAFVEAQLAYERDWAISTLKILHQLGGDSAELLKMALEEFFERCQGSLFLLLSFLLPEEPILHARDALLHGSDAQQQYGLELIETLLPQPMKANILPLVERLPVAIRLTRLDLSVGKESAEHTVTAILKTFTQESWLQACALYVAGKLHLCHDSVVEALDYPEPLVRETAAWALAQFRSEEIPAMPATRSAVEKVLILKTLPIFSETSSDILAEVAGLTEQVRVQAGQNIFHKGELGSSLYVLVSGKVRVHDDDHTLNVLEDRQVFGEMALLDTQPRSASVTAIDDTELLRLDQEPFYELMAEQPDVLRGIIRMLVMELRQRTRELDLLHETLVENVPKI